MRFRFSLWLTLAAIPSLAILIALGVWQLQRADAKGRAIAAYEALEQADAAPDLATLWRQGRAGALGRRVSTPPPTQGEPIRVYGRSAAGPPGWRLMRVGEAPRYSCPEAVDACVEPPMYVLVEVGFEPLSGAPASAAPSAWRIETPPRANAFTPPNDPAARTFYRFVASEIASVSGVEADALIDEIWLVEARDGLPAHLADMPPSRHVGYAVTWFGLALALIGVLVAHAWSRARS